MKVKISFTLTVIMLILFSISAVAADENTTQDVLETAYEDNQNPIDSPDSVVYPLQDVPSGTVVIIDGDKIIEYYMVDLVVTVGSDAYSDFNNKKRTVIGNTLVLSVEATAKNGISKNTTVDFILPEKLEYVSHNTQKGSYNETTGFWDIGDLELDQKAVLNVVTVVNSNEGVIIADAHGATDSLDMHDSNSKFARHVIEIVPKMNPNKKDKYDNDEGEEMTVITGSGELYMGDHHRHYSTSQYSDYRVVSRLGNEPASGGELEIKAVDSDEDDGGSGGGGSNNQSYTPTNQSGATDTGSSMNSSAVSSNSTGQNSQNSTRKHDSNIKSPGNPLLKVDRGITKIANPFIIIIVIIGLVYVVARRMRSNDEG